ncbi:hypothetical protein [Ktedonobacter sp. SOSP1-85]|nr:hypothetical protein [Ktedonobacter sp. SOSP1-85]
MSTWQGQLLHRLLQAWLVLALGRSRASTSQGQKTEKPIGVK